MNSFIIKYVEHININQDMSFSDVMVQFQSHCKKLLCIITKDNQERLHYYEKREQLPQNLIYDSHKNNCYHFNDDQCHYVVFGLPAAKLLCPHIEQLIEPTVISFLRPIHESQTNELKTDNHHYITLYDNGRKYVFPHHNQQLIVTDIKLFN